MNRTILPTVLLCLVLCLAKAQNSKESVKNAILNGDIHRRADPQSGTPKLEHKRKLQTDSVRCGEAPVERHQSRGVLQPRYDSDKKTSVLGGEDAKRDMDLQEFVQISQDIRASFNNGNELLLQRLRLEVTKEKTDLFRDAVDSVRLYTRSFLNSDGN